VLALVDLVIANRVEAVALTGRLGADDAAAALAARAGAAIVTRGADGYALAEGGAVATHRAFAVAAVNSHGAGDMFAGALAAHLAEGAPLAAAARFAAAAAALHVAADDDARARLDRAAVARVAEV
jgi:ribokinase